MIYDMIIYRLFTVRRLKAETKLQAFSGNVSVSYFRKGGRG